MKGRAGEGLTCGLLGIAADSNAAPSPGLLAVVEVDPTERARTLLRTKHGIENPDASGWHGFLMADARKLLR